jgi:hypothetical protein
MPNFVSATEQTITEFLDVEPFKTRSCSFNVWMVQLVSQESGIDDPLDLSYSDTALDSTLRDSTSDPYMTIEANYGQCFSAATAAGVPGCDYIVVIVNDVTGHDGAMAYESLKILLMSNKYPWGAVLAHEMGHLMASLADEYQCKICNPNSAPSSADCSRTRPASVAIQEPNLSETSNRTSLPWANLVQSTTPVPTTLANTTAPPCAATQMCPYPDTYLCCNDADVVGAWEGGGGYAHNVYRSELYCLMDGMICRTTDNFCAACLKALEENIAAQACGFPYIHPPFRALERWVCFRCRKLEAPVPPCWTCPGPDWAVRIVMGGFDAAGATLIVRDDRGNVAATGRSIDRSHVEVSFTQNPLHQYRVCLEFSSSPPEPLEITTELYRNGVKEPLR